MKKRFDLKLIKKILVVGTIIFSTYSIFNTKVFAQTDIELIANEEYYEWSNLPEEEKRQTQMPTSYSVSIPSSILNQYDSLQNRKLFNNLVGNVRCELTDVSAIANDTRYNLADRLRIRVENQGITNECWAFSVLKSMETNIALKNNVVELGNFSERHMDYSSIKTFTDGINVNSLKREAGDGGLPIMGLAYLTNGKGAVLENDMPFVNSNEKISLRELDKNVDTIVTDYIMFPKITKSYQKDSNGNTIAVKYVDSSNKEYSNSELESIREMIKEHLIKNGAIVSFNAGSKAKYYNDSNIFSAVNYNCNDSAVVRDHAVTIVGWDDNYAKENFASGVRPSTNGAYIVLNSYGPDKFNNGYMYVSYEDFFIESELYGIASTSKVDYDKLYQYDNFGGILKLGSDSTNEGYCGVVYNRENTEKKEVLNYVGISLPDYTKVEVYVNPNGASLDSENLVKVGATRTVLEPGYHRIAISPIELKGAQYAVVVKHISENDEFSFALEGNVQNSAYSEIKSENKSFISMDGKTWKNISQMSISKVDMTKSDVCIKAFTTLEDRQESSGEEEQNPEQLPDENQINFSSTEYKVETQAGFIKKIEFNTSIKNFLDNINTNLDIKFLDKNGSEIVNNNEIIKTGMRIKIENNDEIVPPDYMYTLIVRGDINLDGMVSLTDISKFILHYNETEGFLLTGNSLLGADMNCDGKVDLTDLSQMLILYNSI